MTARLLGIGTPALSGAVAVSFLHSTLVLTLPLYLCFIALRSKVASAALEAAQPFALIKSAWQRSLPLQLVTCFSISIVIMGFAPGQLSPFIYFQF